MGISFKPSETVTGGLLQDVDVRINKARYTVFDYNGKAEKPALTVAIAMEPVDGGEEFVQYYSAGSLERFAPSETSDGSPLSSVGDEGCFVVPSEGSTATQLSRSSNFIFFIQELVNASFPEDRIGDDISVLEGTVMHVIRKAAPKREGGPAPVEGAREKTILVPSKVLKLPWEKGAKGAAKAATAAAGAKGGSDVDALTLRTLTTILSANNGSIAPANAKRAATAALLKDRGVSSADRTTVTGRLSDTKWLEANQGADFGFMFIDDTITLL